MQYSGKREKTKKKILNAFLELYIKYDISQITVKMICEGANINRSTFYTYFADVIEAQKSLEIMLVSEMAGRILAGPLKIESLNVDWIASNLIEYIKEKQGMPIYVVRKSASNFAEIITEKLLETIGEGGLQLKKQNQQDIAIAVRYHIGGVVALLETIQEDDPVVDAEQLLKSVARFADQGPLTVVKEITMSEEELVNENKG